MTAPTSDAGKLRARGNRWIGDRWIGLLVTVAVSAGGGLVLATRMPRGPASGVHVVVAMLVCSAAGMVAGLALRSRWAMLLAPAVFVSTFELARLGAVGPSVDRPRLDLEPGVIVLVLGRGLSGLTMLLPMLVGAAYGAGLARRLQGETAQTRGARRIGRHLRHGVAALAALGVVALGVVLTRPGHTDPILDGDGRPVPGSVAELATVRLGGHDQTVLIRGRSTDNPVLLYLSGGPGQSDLGYTRAYMAALEDDFVFAVWDQRGSGTSYRALDPTSTWTLDRAVADTLELTAYLRERFDEEKIYLFGNSWGSLLGVLAVQREPQAYAAYIGAGQMVSPLETDRVIYEDVLEYAARTGDAALAQRMRAWGEPPYEDIYAYGFLIGYYDKIAPYPKTGYFTSRRPSGIDGNGATEYGPLDKVNKLKAIVDMGSVMYPQVQHLDFRSQVPSLDVPVYLAMGAHELRARTAPARQWFDLLQSPVKRWVDFPASGHVPQFEEFGRFRALLAEVVDATRATMGG